MPRRPAASLVVVQASAWLFLAYAASDEARDVLLLSSQDWLWSESSSRVGWTDSAQEPKCSWTGISCTPQGTISALDLGQQLQGGSLDWNITQLGTIQFLNLSHNLLEGSLLPVLGFQMPNLRQLDLGSNDLTAGIPDEWAAEGAFPHLELLWLSGNRGLGGTLPPWGNSSSAMPKLRNFNCRTCGLTDLEFLEAVLLTYNSITGTLPENLAKLPMLIFGAGFNHLSGTLPASYGNWTKAYYFGVGVNKLTGQIPGSYGAMRNLTRTDPSGLISVGLDLSSNYLFGPIPPSLAYSLPGGRLRPGNYLCGTPANNFDDFDQSERWSLRGNLFAFADPYRYVLTDPSAPIKGPTFKRCGTAAVARVLNTSMVDIPLSGPVRRARGWGRGDRNPCTWPGLACDAEELVTAVNMAGWGLQGSITQDWDQLSPLTALDLSGNHLRGSLAPSWADSWQNMSSVDFSGNEGIAGHLPAGWAEEGAFPHLQYLSLANSGLGGGLPKWSLGMPELTTLVLANASLDAPIPAGWLPDGALGALQHLDLSDNPRMGGTLPELGTAEAALEMQTLLLNGSSFTGPLPPTLANLTDLRLLDISNNGLGGPLPAAYGSNDAWRLLQRLNLSHNRLTGSMPAWGSNGSLSELRTLDLSGNAGLNGSVPDLRANGRLPRLEALILQPGTGLCGSLPVGLPVLNADRSSWAGPSLEACPGSSDNAQTAASSASSAGLTGAAIAGIVIGIVAGCGGAGLVMWLALRARHRARSKGRPADQLTALPTLLSSGSQSPSMTSTSRATPDSLSLQFDPVQALSMAATSPPHGAGSWDLRSVAEVPDDLVHDITIEPSRIAICAHPDGTAWVLGSGGYGKVYRAILDGAIECAIKFLGGQSSSIATYDLQYEAFVREVSVLKSCKHDNVVGFIGAFLHRDYTYLVQELLECDLLFAIGDKEKSRHLVWSQRGKQIVMDIAQALAYLHSNGIIHLDIKSPNILLDSNFRAKVGDVGLARLLLSRTHLSIAQAGTYDYQAPETMLGQRASFPADMYSFGVVCLELLTGFRQRRGRYDFLQRKHCPQEMADLVDRCINAKPHDRPSAPAIIEALHKMP